MDWQRLSDLTLAVVGLSTDVPGEPVRPLLPVALDQLRSEG